MANLSLPFHCDFRVQSELTFLAHQSSLMNDCHFVHLTVWAKVVIQYSSDVSGTIYREPYLCQLCFSSVVYPCSDVLRYCVLVTCLPGANLCSEYCHCTLYIVDITR